MARFQLCCLMLMLTACATTPSQPPITPERRAHLYEAAQACQQRYPQVVEKYAIDRFGQITATVHGGRRLEAQPFFACMSEKLGHPVEPRFLPGGAP